MLEMKDVTKTFGSFKALDCLSLNVPKGAVYGLVGPNGAGKTTAIRHLTGVYRPDSGSVTLEGAPIDENLAAKERICCVADEPFYFPGASLEEMKNFYAGLYPKFDGKRFDELQDVFRLRRKAPLRRFSREGLADISDHFIRVDKIIHGHEIEAGSEFVPEQQFRDFLKQVPRREQKEKEDGKPPVPPSAVPLPRQEQQVRQHGQD